MNRKTSSQPKRFRLIFLVIVFCFLVTMVARWNPDPSAKGVTLDTTPVTFINLDEDNHLDEKAEASMKDYEEKWIWEKLWGSHIGPKVELVQKEMNVVVVDVDAAYKNVVPVWTYRCDVRRGCIRAEVGENETPIEPEVCWLNCGSHGPLWPYPSKNATSLGQCLTKFQKGDVTLRDPQMPNENVKSLIMKMWDVFMTNLNKTENFDPFPAFSSSSPKADLNNAVEVELIVSDNVTLLGLTTDESFTLKISNSFNTNSQDASSCPTAEDKVRVQVQIHASSIFGARHGLETLFQLIAFDKRCQCFQILSDASVEDEPVFPYRGILIDTARNFIPIDDLKRMIDGMAHNKLNIFHWHLTDSNSFPFYSKTVPQMTLYGAYSPEKVYYPSDIQELISYALVRGVKVLPELDAPAHAGNGWQWGSKEGLGDLAVCINAEPWRHYCGQPPCGQLNPINPNTYAVLENLYRDFMEAFDSDLFHMGGDEVYFKCWEQYPDILAWTMEKKLNIFTLWSHFQDEALKRLKNANEGKPMRVIVWTSAYTNSKEGRDHLNASDYIIQIWDGSPVHIATLIKENYQIILSNIDAAYLDHGGGTWLGSEHTYQFKLWQNIYDNNIERLVPNFKRDLQNKADKKQVLGGEATLWSEKVNSDNMDSRTWPRGAATAENLWSHPTSRSPMVYSRLNHHNRRLLRLGIHSDQLQPESCYLISGHCEDPSHPI